MFTALFKARTAKSCAELSQDSRTARNIGGRNKWQEERSSSLNLQVMVPDTSKRLRILIFYHLLC
ncbi:MULTISPECIES: hypothetical protein, partial [unclassified Mesorhizobium]|uniref:hypothetical protein n=1 Tax=unclassified Mesorhizobium TaxID=325217 RepID=UPI001AEE5198